jgi:ankyrin repeat protein
MRKLALILLALVATAAQAQSPEDRLFEALVAGKQLVAEGIIVRGGLNLDARNAQKETPLHVAVEKGYKELTALLLKAGAPVGARSGNGETP